MAQSKPVNDPEQTPWQVSVDQNLRTQVAVSGMVRMAAQVVKVAVAVATGMLLARLLTPRDFGLIAMVESLIAFVASFRDFGLTNAAVFEDKLEQRQMSALFWLNFKLNLLIVAFMLAMAPVLAWFYGEARLSVITLVMAVGIFGIGLSNQHESILTRQMKFGVLTLIDIGSVLLGAAAGIGGALLGMQYWALVLQFVVVQLTCTIATWWACDWRPSGWLFQKQDVNVSAMIAYGRNVSLFRVIAHVGRNIDRVLVGYFSGATVMGLYDKAYQWSIFPINQVNGPLLSVLVASLSRVQHDAKLYREYSRRSLMPVFVLCMPALAFMAIEARAVILFLLGDQWVEAIPLFQIFCVAAFIGIVNVVTKPLYLSQGRTRQQLQWGLIYTPLMILAVVIGSFWGAYGVAVGFAAGTIVLAYPSVLFCLRGSHLTQLDFLRILWRPALASLGAAAGVLLVRLAFLLPENVFLELLITAPVFGLLFVVLWVALPGGRAMTRDMVQVFLEMRRARGRSSGE